MFQDDRMIPMLSAAVLMVVFGTVVQRMDGLHPWLGGEAPAEIVLRDDEVAAATNALLRIDVFANDDGIEEAMREGLTVVSAPACGRLFVRSGQLEYQPEVGCEGRQTIRYTVAGAPPEQIAAVTAEVRGSGDPLAIAADTRGRASRSEVAATAGPAAAESDDGTPAMASAGAPTPDAAARPVMAGIAPASASAPHAAVADARTAGAVPASVAPSRGGTPHAPLAALAGPRAVTPATSAHPSAGRTEMTMTASSSDAVGSERAVSRAERADQALPPGILGAAPDAIATGADALVPEARRPSAVETAYAGAPEATALRAPRPTHSVGAIADLAASGPTAGTPTPSALRPNDTDRSGLTPTPVLGAETAALVSDPAGGVAGGDQDAIALVSAPSALPRAEAGRQTGVAPEPARTASGEAAAHDRLPGTPALPRQARGAEPVAPGAPAYASPGPSTALASAAIAPEPGEVGGAAHPGAWAPEDATRLAALPRAAEIGSAEPDRRGIRLALVPPAEADQAFAVGLREDPAMPRMTRLTMRAGPAGPGGTPLVAAPRPPAPRVALAAPGSLPGALADASPAASAAADGPAFVLSVVGHANAATPGAGGAIPPAAAEGPPDEVILAALAPAPLLGPALPGPALDVLPGEPEGPPRATGRFVIPVPRPTSFGGADTDADPLTAAVPEAVAPCVIVPGLILDVRGAGTTILGVDAPCQAGTVAELIYSGLRLAVPLDGNGQGSVTVLGFEPNTPAVVTFRDGMSLPFELPFRGVDQVSRVALAWDSPIELGLNALERGAEPNSPGHVRPGVARSLEEARENGGGYLGVWWPVAGVGQSVQIYSWYHRSRERPGVVRMMVDFVSRDRDHLASACGSGPDAAPQYMVLRSDAGRPERPVIRRLAPIDCQQVAEGGRDNRLITGAVDDLVITSR